MLYLFDMDVIELDQRMLRMLQLFRVMLQAYVSSVSNVSEDVSYVFSEAYCKCVYLYVAYVLHIHCMYFI